MKHWQKYNKTITALCVGKHPDLSTLAGLFPPHVDKSGCFPTQRAVIVYYIFSLRRDEQNLRIRIFIQRVKNHVYKKKT